MSAVVESDHALENSLSETQGTTQLVSFGLAGELYGIDITSVREIILITDITRVPQTPHYVVGVINLRSSIIPVVDLRTLFALPAGAKTDESRIMVLQAGGRTVGVLVDAVHEVLRVRRDRITPTPPTVAGQGQEYLAGLVRLEKQLLILLDIDKVLDSQMTELAGT